MGWTETEEQIEALRMEMRLLRGSIDKLADEMHAMRPRDLDIRMHQVIADPKLGNIMLTSKDDE